MNNTFAAVRNRARLSFFFSDAICVSVVLQIIYVFLCLPQKPYVFPCSRSPRFPRDETWGRNPGRLFLNLFEYDLYFRSFANHMCLSSLLQIPSLSVALARSNFRATKLGRAMCCRCHKSFCVLGGTNFRVTKLWPAILLFFL